MNIYDIAKIVNGEIFGKYSNKLINKIKTDTRLLEENDLFIALKGNNYDGTDFIKDIKINISGIIVDRDLNFNLEIPIIKVKNTLLALQDITKYIRTKYINTPLIAITGSTGKTTTKELIYDILKNNYNVLKNEGSYNNNIGVPLTMFNLNSSHDLILIEMGMNHAHEIELLSKTVKPNIAIITNIGSSHIGNLKTKKNILASKLEITSGLDNGLLIVNGYDSYLKKVKYKRIIKSNSLVPYNIICKSDKTLFKLKIDKKEYQIIYNIVGSHLINDILIAIMIGLMFNININSIIKSIYDFKMPPHRLNVIHKDNYVIIDDTYNSSYESLKGLLDNYKNNDKKIIILGDILELGDKSISIHKKINRLLKKIPNANILCIGEHTKYIKGTHFDTIDDILKYLESINLDESYIIIKASRKMGLDYLVNKLS